MRTANEGRRLWVVLRIELDLDSEGLSVSVPFPRERVVRYRNQLVIAKRYPEEMGFSGLEVTIIVPMAAITPLIAPQAT